MSVFNPECTSNYFQVQDIDPSECTGGNPLRLQVPHQGGRKHVRVRWLGHGRPAGDEGRDQQGDDARASSSP